MYVLEIPMPDALKGEIIDALACRFGYQATLTDHDGNSSPNPEAKGDFVSRSMQDWVMSVTRECLADKALSEAQSGIDTTMQTLAQWYAYWREHGEEPPGE